MAEAQMTHAPFAIPCADLPGDPVQPRLYEPPVARGDTDGGASMSGHRPSGDVLSDTDARRRRNAGQPSRRSFERMIVNGDLVLFTGLVHSI